MSVLRIAVAVVALAGVAWLAIYLAESRHDAICAEPLPPGYVRMEECP